METQSQQNALKSLIENIYRSDLKSFLIDLAEVVESNDERLIESLWECALMIPMDPSRP